MCGFVIFQKQNWQHIIQVVAYCYCVAFSIVSDEIICFLLAFASAMVMITSINEIMGSMALNLNYVKQSLFIIFRWIITTSQSKNNIELSKVFSFKSLQCLRIP